MTPSVWLRAVRARFMAASAIAVAAGLAASHHAGHALSATDAAITLAGVLALHASVDLLNDYWDHRRGIDARTVRTPYSGGTGVIASGALSARAVRLAGLAALGAGLAAGAYFVLSHGLPIAVMLAFAAASVYFYSTRVVDSGLAEALVAAKGALIVMGTSYIQSGSLGDAAVAAGVCVGTLSSIVLLATSFPDRDADREGGRRTLVVVVGPAAASYAYAALVAAFGAALAVSVALGALPPACAAALGALPLAASAARRLWRAGADAAALVPAMRRTVAFARLAGALVTAGLLV
ncbi:MAG: prenyltransferase [Thaumarchaeota archaeon]|nr:prenyltransferase [Nitrososphaerota archaeon]MDD9843691.1 prenyltransferase [Nitrososphaerota archaeon]